MYWVETGRFGKLGPRIFVVFGECSVLALSVER